MNKIFTIGPLRMEFLSRNPDVVQIHNAFNNADVSELSTLSAAPGVKATKNNSRIEQKLAAMTGLQHSGLSDSEKLEIVGDLPGGYTDTHVDAVSFTESCIIRL